MAGPATLAIQRLGAKRIAGACDLTTDAVWKWPRDNADRIPAKHQPTVFRLAVGMGVALSAEEIIGVAPRPRP
jgi:hypothetical protein